MSDWLTDRRTDRLIERKINPLSSAEAQSFFSGGEDPLSNVSAGTGLPATAESIHPGKAIFCGLLAGVASVPCISKNGVQDFEVK